MGEPCGVPRSRSLSSDRVPLNLRRTFLSLRNDAAHLWISGGKPKSCITWIRQAWLTLSKKPWMSKRSIPHFKLAWCAKVMSWMRARPASVHEDAFLPPN